MKTVKLVSILITMIAFVFAIIWSGQRTQSLLRASL